MRLPLLCLALSLAKAAAWAGAWAPRTPATARARPIASALPPDGLRARRPNDAKNLPKKLERSPLTLATRALSLCVAAVAGMRSLERLYREGAARTTTPSRPLAPGTIADLPLFRVPWTALPGVVQVLQVRRLTAREEGRPEPP